MIVATTTAADETQQLGAAIAELVRPGDLVLLAGELGAGKTALVQGIGRGLGITEPITSPTFVLARQHDGGRVVLHHIDVYRLEQMHEVFDVGLPELLDEGGVAVVEWGDVAAAVLAPDFLEVCLEQGAGDDDRLVTLRATGGRWSSRLRPLAVALDRWLVSDAGEGSAR